MMSIKFFGILLFISSAASAAPLMNLDLDATSKEYDLYFESHPEVAATANDEPSIAKALTIGQRLSAWIEFENQKRPANLQLRLTSPSNRVGTPIESPKMYNPNTIQNDLDNALNVIPAGMKSVVLGTGNFPNQIPTSDQDFITFGRKIDKVYQSAARWKSLKPWIYQYSARKADDIRGYYFLKKEGWDEKKLSQYHSLDAATQAKLKDYLLMTCLNAGVAEFSCEAGFNQAISTRTVGAFYTKYQPQAKARWDSYFVIPNGVARTDITWTSSDPKTATVLFNTPALPKIQSYLKDNIEDEWKWKGWNLRMSFGNYPNSASVVFQTGVVPHVNGLGGNEIVMDQNQSVEEYESQWTIRHEFGHVLGFPDCYFEFYDTQLKAFVSYQLDITDLMCSRAGNMKERLFTELKRVYFSARK